MMPLVEDLLQQTIQDQLKYLQSNLDIIDIIFQQASVTNRTKLKNYLGQNGIKVTKGFPIDQSQLPSYCIMLGAEQEQSEAIGNYLYDDDDNRYDLTSFTETLTIKKYNASTYFVETTHKPLFDIKAVSYDGVSYDPEEIQIIDNNKGLLFLDFPVDLTVANSLSITYDYKSTGYADYGTLFHSQYRVETWTNNGDLTVLLYHLLKWIFLTQRGYLAQNGLAVQNLGGTDFEPAPEYFPEFVFRRALTFECTVEASVEESFTYSEGLNTP